jgi:hypothetical protein
MSVRLSDSTNHVSPSPWLVLALQHRHVSNALKETIRTRLSELVMVVIGFMLIIAYAMASAYKALVDGAAIIQNYWPILRIGCFGIILVDGMIAGYIAGSRAMTAATANWLAALPWSIAARRRAARYAGLANGLALSVVVCLVAWFYGQALPLHYPGVSSIGVAIVFGVAFCGGTLLCTARWNNRIAGLASARKNSAPKSNWMLDRIDRPRPVHAGLWALSDRLRVISRVWVVTLLVCGGIGVATSIAQGTAVPALVIAVLGGNALFILSLRCQPMVSPVFRATQLGYARAMAAMIRIPVALSFAWFTPLALAALAVDLSAWQMLPIMTMALVVMDALYMAANAARPSAPGQARMLYAIAIYAVLYEALAYGVPYGGLALLIVCGGALFFCRQARIRYRAANG